MASLLLIDYLERSRAFYTLKEHPAAFTAAETARLNRVTPRHFAKTVMVRVDSELAMMVVPCHYRVALEDLRSSLGATTVELAPERQFQRRFPRCEVGAMPPFGHLFGLRAFMVPLFDEFSDIHFKAGSHNELLRMPFSEFRRLAHVETVMQGAVPKLRNLAPAHLQRLFDLAVGKKQKVGGGHRHRHPVPLIIPS
jgi:Ala-tRNA(Pro) deacylase